MTSYYRFLDRELRNILIKNKKKRIAICPMGIIGMQVKNILNYRYGVKEAFVIDNGLAEINPSILRMEEIKQRDNEEDLIIILSAKSPKVRAELKAEMQNLNIQCDYIELFSPHIIEKNEKHIYFEQLKALFETKRIVNKKLKRIGNNYDGGYVMCDDFEAGQVAYSFGLGWDVSWDAHIASYGLKIYMYDPTINKLPEENDKFHFFKLGIGPKDCLENSMCSMKTLLKINGHEDVENKILKMDIEGAEWDVIDSMPNGILDKFSQLTFEFHGLTKEENKEQKFAVLKKLNQTHQAIWVHGNNCGTVESADGILMPDSLEVTYMNRSRHAFQEVLCEYPTDLDFPNCEDMDDIYLGNWGKTTCL